MSEQWSASQRAAFHAKKQSQHSSGMRDFHALLETLASQPASASYQPASTTGFKRNVLAERRLSRNASKGTFKHGYADKHAENVFALYRKGIAGNRWHLVSQSADKATAGLLLRGLLTETPEKHGILASVEMLRFKNDGTDNPPAVIYAADMMGQRQERTDVTSSYTEPVRKLTYNG